MVRYLLVRSWWTSSIATQATPPNGFTAYLGHHTSPGNHIRLNPYISDLHLILPSLHLHQQRFLIRLKGIKQSI